MILSCLTALLFCACHSNSTANSVQDDALDNQTDEQQSQILDDKDVRQDAFIKKIKALGLGTGSFDGKNTEVEKTVIETINQARTLCGFGELAVNQQLNIITNNHSNYLKVLSEHNKDPFISLYEQPEWFYDGRQVEKTGVENAYFSGITSQDRLASQHMGVLTTPANYQARFSVETQTLGTLGAGVDGVEIDESLQAKSMVTGVLSTPYQMIRLLIPYVKDVGVSFMSGRWQVDSSRIIANFLVMLTALDDKTPIPMQNKTLTYPCQGAVTGHTLTNDVISPLDGSLTTNRSVMLGQPIYVRAKPNIAIDSVSASIVSHDGQHRLEGKGVHSIDYGNDPHGQLKAYEALLIPNAPLKPNKDYTVKIKIISETNRIEHIQFDFKTNKEVPIEQIAHIPENQKEQEKKITDITAPVVPQILNFNRYD